MTRRSALMLVTLSIALARGVSARADVDIQTAISQTALWVGGVVTYTVRLTCRADVDILQEDLDADRLPLSGLQVVSHDVDRTALSDGRTAYAVSYRLTTFEPGSESVGIGDWTVRYAARAQTAGASAPALEVQIPGAALAWRSALPAALNTLALRDARNLDRVPSWWQSTRAAGIALLVVSALSFGSLAITRVAATRRPKVKRRPGKESARDLEVALAALRTTGVANPADRLKAYETLEAAVRRRAGDVGSLPGAALTPPEFAARLSSQPAALPADAVARILAACEQARYQPIDRLPAEQDFIATLDAAEQLLVPAR
jgi:hypothetical protein